MKTYETSTNSDDPTCPYCKGYNALISRAYRYADGSVGKDWKPDAEEVGLTCRDCGKAALHPNAA